MLNSEKLSVALVQSGIIWEDVNANLIALSNMINAISTDVDLIVLPEMFTTGFTMNAEKLAETMNGKTICWMQEMASKKQVAIVGSVIICENNQFYNRLLFVHPSEKTKYYDKRHTFTLANEHKVFSAGTTKTMIEFKGWKICPLICYDLRFPVWSRNIENYDMLLYVASWPKVRINAWDALLKARAIENMSYTLGVNRVGLDGSNYEYVGHSIAFDFLGNPLSEEKNERETVIIVELEKNKQEKIRNKFGFLNDKDSFKF